MTTRWKILLTFVESALFSSKLALLIFLLFLLFFLSFFLQRDGGERRGGGSCRLMQRVAFFLLLALKLYFIWRQCFYLHVVSSCRFSLLHLKLYRLSFSKLILWDKLSGRKVNITQQNNKGTSAKKASKFFKLNLSLINFPGLESPRVDKMACNLLKLPS